MNKPVEYLLTLVMTGIAIYFAIDRWNERHPKPREAPKPHIEKLDQWDAYKLDNGNSIGVPGTLRRAVVFSDYECPYCGQFPRTPIYKQLVTAAKDGKILLTLMDYPLPMHDSAMDAAKVAQCAATQGKFWEVDALLHRKYKTLDEMLPKIEIKPCAENFEERINASVAVANKIHVNSTPTLWLATNSGTGLTGLVYPGANVTTDILEKWLQ